MTHAVEFCASSHHRPARRSLATRLLGRLLSVTPGRASSLSPEALSPYMLRDIGLADPAHGDYPSGRTLDWSLR
jgi:hypothetical protein